MDFPTDSAELWRLTWEHSPIGMALVRLDGRVVMANRALCEMLGYDATELAQRGFQELTHADDLDADVELFERTLAGEIDSYRVEKRYLHADGHLVWGDLSVALVREPDGNPLHFISQVLDVTEQKDHQARLEAANAEVERERQSLEAIFETVSVGLLLIGSDGHYERMNRRHRETMNLPFPEGHDGEAGQLGEVYFLDGKTPMSKEDMPSFRAAQGEEFDDYTYWVGADSRTRAAFATSARQVRGPGGERRGAALAYQEITPLMRAMQLQDEFVSSVSHELRTPLTSILGYLELLCEHEELPEDVAAQLQVVQRNAQRLMTLLAGLLYVGKVAEAGLTLQLTEVDLSRLVEESVEAARPGAEKSGVAISVDAPDHLVARVDEEHFRQVVDNLVSNAVKYTDADGSVTVGLHRVGSAVELDVADTGVGISLDDAAHVFDRFYRSDTAVEKQIPGTGLGLNIVRSIVTAHQGTVSLSSEPGVGSTFRVTLPDR